MWYLFGTAVVLVVLWLLHMPVSHILLVAAAYNAGVAAVAWYNEAIDAWFGGLGLTAICFTGVSLAELLTSTFLRVSYRAMPAETKCCIPRFGCASPRSILFLTCMFRGLAGLTAAASFYVTWTARETFWAGHTTVVIAMWVVTSGLWLLSCVPHFVALLQCAATQESKHILRFRKRVTIWLIHDVVLGVFWLYLACMLDHLLKDDDSEWRTVFLSMLSWHIIIFVCRQLYMSDMWSQTKHVGCCAPETVGRWSVVFMLVAMSVVYGVLVHVVRDSVDMGCSAGQVALMLTALFVGCIGYLMSSPTVPKSLMPTRHVPKTTLDF